jgi:hypothetical protein
MLKIERTVHPEEPLMSFDDWMCFIVKSTHYTDDDAMSRARENLKNYENGIDKSSKRDIEQKSGYIAKQQQISY